MYYITFARYDAWYDDGVASGRACYITDSASDAEREWYDVNHMDSTMDGAWTVRRGGVFGPFDSLDDEWPSDCIAACDEIYGPMAA